MAVKKKLDYEGLEMLSNIIKNYINNHNDIPVGHEYFSFNPNIPEGSLPLFGGEYSRKTYSNLWKWVQKQTGYLKTEIEWQELSTNNNGNVPFYSDGDGSTTFRVPSLKCWVKSANGTISEVGSYLEAGLPNITAGKITTQDWGTVETQMTGAWNQSVHNTKSNNAASGTSADEFIFSFDASRSNSIYGSSSQVQPRSIVGLWLVKAYSTVVETGVINEKQYIDDKISTCLPITGGTMLGTINFGESGAIGYKGSWHTNNGQYLPQLVISSTDINDWENSPGAKMVLHTYGSTGTSSANGGFEIVASDGTNSKILKGYPDGGLSWDGKNIVTTNGVINGNITFSGTAPSIAYQGSQTTYSLIRFIDNASDTYGNGISIGGGGAVIIGGGEASTTMQDTIIGTAAGKGGSEVLALCGDGNVDVYSNCQNGAGSSFHFTFRTDGVLVTPKASQVSSDKRLKQDFSDIPDEILNAWDKVNWSLFKYKTDVKNDGNDKSCYHAGLVAQDVKEIGDSFNVDLCKYGILYHNTQNNDDSWSVSYIEALAVEAAYQRHRADKLEERISELEKLLKKVNS